MNGWFVDPFTKTTVGRDRQFANRLYGRIFYRWLDIIPTKPTVMLRFMEKIGELLLSQHERSLELRELKVQFVRNRQAIQQHLRLCKKSGGIIGVYAARLGQGMFLGTVTSIHYDVISLRPIDDNESTAKTIMIPLNEITSVCPFNQVYHEYEQHLENATHEHDAEFRLAHAN